MFSQSPSVDDGGGSEEDTGGSTTGSRQDGKPRLRVHASSVVDTTSKQSSYARWPPTNDLTTRWRAPPTSPAATRPTQTHSEPRARRTAPPPRTPGPSRSLRSSADANMAVTVRQPIATWTGLTGAASPRACERQPLRVRHCHRGRLASARAGDPSPNHLWPIVERTTLRHGRRRPTANQ